MTDDEYAWVPTYTIGECDGCDGSACDDCEDCTCEKGEESPQNGGICRHCGLLDEYPERGNDGKVCCWRCVGRDNATS